MSAIWERKVRTHFRRKDFDKDGVIHRKDFVGMAERFADKEKFDKKQKKTAAKCFDDLFSFYVSSAGKHSDALTEDVMVQSIRDLKDDSKFKKCLTDLLLSLLEPLDVNQDGYLDADEYRRAFENVGIVESDFTKAGFEALDTNHDGKLSFEEFVNALINYSCSDEENTTAVFGLVA